jgi:high affinity Mn2+ porin
VKTREPGDLPERSHPSGVRGARAGRTSAAVTTRFVTRMEAAMIMPAHFLSNNARYRARFVERQAVATLRSVWAGKLWLAISVTAIVIASAERAKADDAMVTKAPPIPYASSSAYNWTGFYAGGHLGVAWGNSSWTAAPGITGSTNLFQPIDTFNESGSFFTGIQAGYKYMLPTRVLMGAEIDASFPSFPSLAGLTIGGISNFASPTLGAVSYSETVHASGTMRGRIGYAPGDWLFYATGGFAWTYNQQTLTQLASGTSQSPFIWRLGWAVGAGVEVPVAPHWTARLEYLFTDFGNKNQNFFAGAQPINSDFVQQELRASLNYHFGGDAVSVNAPLLTKAPATPDPDIINFHGQATFAWQGYPQIRSAFEGPNSLPAGGQNRETIDATLATGVRLWQGAEFWADPEIDQGHGLADTHGVAGFPSAEAYKFGNDYPYARVQRYFVRQTIDLGGESQKVDADFHQFAGSQTENRLVLTVGKFAIVDLFDTNRYANNPKSDFLNWSVVNAGTFDYAGDAWGYTYGAAAEWYLGRFTLRGGVFDMSVTPAEAANSAAAYGLDPTFSQTQFVGEIEERHELWGQPGKLKLTAFVTHGRMGDFQDAVALSQPGQPFAGDANNAIASLRTYRYRPGVSLNFEQQVTETLGVFGRAGWADGSVEPWDFTEIDRTMLAGVSIGGKQWGRPNDTIGIAGVINGLAPVHAAYFNAGGTGIIIGDGALPSYRLEQIVEAYYSYALTASTKISVDYQFIANPGYNAERGPVNVFAGRFHTQF